MAVTINGTTGIETNTDTGKIKVGIDDDLTIEHNGTDSVIDSNTGALHVKSNSSIAMLVNNTEDAIVANANGEVKLYHDNTLQCSTSANGLAFPSGKGIDFSATSDAGGMTNELLDDYEEGTYTPIVLASGSSSGLTMTYSQQHGHYTKIGDLVHYCLEMDWTAKSGTNSNSGSYYLNISLPFAAKTAAGVWGSSTINWNTGLEFDNGGAYCHHNKDGAYMFFWSPLESGRHDYYVRTSNLHSSGGIRMAGTFKTA